MSSAIKLSLVSMLVLCVMFLHATAGCRLELYCGLRCSRRGCAFRCYLRCSSRGKRSIRGPDGDSNEKPLPSKFGEYDLNKDGGVTLEELAEALEVAEHAEGTEIAFRRADRNGDGQLNCEEFQDGPFLFNHRPTC